MSVGRLDPGECIVCGAAHSSCGGGGPIAVVQLPARDAAAARDLIRPALAADAIQATLPPGRFTTGTYRGKRQRTRG